MATPSLDHDPSNASSPLYNSENVAGSSSDGHSGGQHGSQSAAHKYSNGPHIRSRITVVCAECKRLKLKCDRRTPCSSCLKRDTVQRCLYSQAAAEKIDVQSLHNRLLVVEGHLAQLTSSSSSSVPPFKSSYPGSTPPQPYPTSSSQANTSTFALRPHSSTSLGVCPSNEHALLVTGGSGSSVVISLDDAVGLWMNEVETPLAVDDSLKPSGGRSNTTGAGGVRVKLEPTPVSIPPSSTPMPGHLRNTAGCTSAFVPPLPYSIFLPASDSRIPTPQSHLDPISPLRGDLPQVTPTLLLYLPTTPSMRSRYMQSLSELMLIHPCFNVQHFEKRVEAMLAWGETNRGAENAAKRDLAREVFFGGAGGGQAKRSAGKERGSHSKASSPKPTLSFFSASCAAFALGALMTRDHPSDNPGSSSSSSPSPEEEAMRVRRSDPTALFALSEQCLHFFEKTHAYDVDSVIAMLLQILYMLHDGQMQVGQTVLPLVGKVVNVARMMGLGIDPDEFAGTYSLFEAETRRRVWWDVFYYDMLVSECMGQQPLIPESSFTTKIPADVDEDKFNPSTTTIPTLPTEDGEAVPTYLGLKCRLAQLVKSIRRQVAKDLADEEVSLDQAASFETEISTWLTELPHSYRLDMELDVAQPLPPSSSPTSPFLLAQRCELVIAANRVVLKLYMPFMKEAGTANFSKPSHQALMGTINAAHAIIYASRVLHTLWRDIRPAAFDFYEYGRSLFDAAVVCAYAVIQQPKSILAAEAIKGVSGALEVMRALDNSKVTADSSNAPSEAVRVVELMKDKAERARMPDSSAGSKRKRGDGSPLQEPTLSGGFVLPFVGASVSSVRPEQPPRPVPLATKIAALASGRKDSMSNPHEPKVMKSSRDKGKDKPSKYPTIGIRVRTSQSASPASQTQTSGTPLRTTNPPVPSPASPPDRSQQSSTLSSHSNATYQYPPSLPHTAHTQQSQPQQQQQQQQHSVQHQPELQSTTMTHEFQMEYTHNPPPAEEHYQTSYTSNSPSGSTSTYDQQPASSLSSFDHNAQSNNAYHAPPPPPPPPQNAQEYYINSPFAPEYGQTVQNMGMPTQYGMSPIDTSIPTGGLASNVSSIPNTPRDSYPPPPHFDRQVAKSELERQINSEYQPTATSHGMTMSATAMAAPFVQQRWQQPEMRPNDSWEYKFYQPHA